VELASATHRRVELTALTAAHRIPAIYQRFFPGRLDRFELPGAAVHEGSAKAPFVGAESVRGTHLAG
jgi:hypothetical protein